MKRWRPSLTHSLAAALALAFTTGLLLAYVSPFAPAPARAVTVAKLHGVVVDAADSLQAGLAQRRREIEFLAAAFPAKSVDAPDRTALRLLLRRAQELSPYYALIGLVDASGRMVVTSNGLAEGADVSGRDYFRRGLAGSYLSDAHPAMLLAKATGAADSAPRLIDVATPVSDGVRTIGVLVAHISAEWAQVIATTSAQRSGLKGARLEIRDSGGENIAVAGNPAAPPAGPDCPRETVAGIGDGGAAHWTVVASLAAAPVAFAGLSNKALAGLGLLGVLAAAGLGWRIGHAIKTTLETHTRSVVLLPAGRIPEVHNGPSRELTDLSAAIRLAAEELASNRRT